MGRPTTTTGTVFPEARTSAADRARLREEHYNAAITSIRAHRERGNVHYEEYW